MADAGEALPAAVLQASVAADLNRLHAAGVAVNAAPEELQALCVGSDWAVDLLCREPALLDRLVAANQHRVAPGRATLVGELNAELAGVDGSDPSPTGPFGDALRDFRNRHMIGILLRDLARHADLPATTAALSDLAEVIITAALGLLQPHAIAEWGRPLLSGGGSQELVVIAMGKLGARELNLSSDIDLLFVHAEGGEVEGGAGITCQEFFTRLGRRLIALLDAHTSRGFVFRVDMRLRPFGSSGPLVLTLKAFFTYYETQGRDWERYAFVKARAITGDAAITGTLERRLRPFVYRRYLDFSAIAALREMKAKIHREVQRRSLEADVKLGPGGIREVEFIVQVFQLIHGGRDYALQKRALLEVLPALVRARHLSAHEAEQLTAAYVFLREVEHRLQALNDAQTQRLPTATKKLMRVAAAMGCPDQEDFIARLDAHRANVARSFGALIATVEEPATPPSVGASWQDFWQALAVSDEAGDHPGTWLEARLADAGFTDPGAARTRLSTLARRRTSVVTQEVGRERLDALMPLLLARVAATRSPDATLERSLRLIEAVLRRTAYLVLLLENPGALDLLVHLMTEFERVARALARHPALLDVLLDHQVLHRVPTRELLAGELARQLAGLKAGDLEAQMEQLRYFKVTTELQVAACEVADLLPLMQVSDALSWLAEVILDQVVTLAWNETVTQYGAPTDASGAAAELAFGVIGYGKLGGLEMGWGSDVDLVFLHDLPVRAMTTGAQSVANSQFMARMGQHMIHLLSTRTFTGRLYEVDLRLRPSGGAGVLVASLESFAAYQRDSAWTWEHQALVRARPVAGAPRVGQAFTALREEILARQRDRDVLRQNVTVMRERMMAEHHLKRTPEQLAGRKMIDLKQAPGAVLDIEFMVQFWVLGWGSAYPALLVYTDVVRILEVAANARVLDARDADYLVESYKAFRARAHRAALQDQPARSDAADLIERADCVNALWLLTMASTGARPADAGVD